MSIDWTGKTWRIDRPGCGLSSGDVLRFVGSDIQVKPSGSAAFETAWGTYSNGSSSGCVAQAYGTLYTIQHGYNEMNKDTLTCTGSNECRSDAVVDTGLGLLWDAPSTACTGSAGLSFDLFLSQAEGPNGPSWTAIEGG